MSKFKVGDKVRLVSPDLGEFIKGELGTVAMNMGNMGVILVEREKSGEVFAVAPKHLEPAIEQPQKTLRDEFAMAALQGLLSDSDFDPSPEEAAIASYRLADAMLEERNKSTNKEEIK